MAHPVAVEGARPRTARKNAYYRNVDCGLLRVTFVRTRRRPADTLRNAGAPARYGATCRARRGCRTRGSCDTGKGAPATSGAHSRAGGRGPRPPSTRVCNRTTSSRSCASGNVSSAATHAACPSSESSQFSPCLRRSFSVTTEKSLDVCAFLSERVRRTTSFASRYCASSCNPRDPIRPISVRSVSTRTTLISSTRSSTSSNFTTSLTPTELLVPRRVDHEAPTQWAKRTMEPLNLLRGVDVLALPLPVYLAEFIHGVENREGTEALLRGPGLGGCEAPITLSLNEGLTLGLLRDGLLLGLLLRELVGRRLFLLEESHDVSRDSRSGSTRRQAIQNFRIPRRHALLPTEHLERRESWAEAARTARSAAVASRCA